MAFQQGLSGLASSSKSIDVTSNNIANASTVGFKVASAQFADVYASALIGGGSSIQIGIGAAVNSVKQAFTQGNLATTNNPLDMGINGNGFFRIAQNDGTFAFTRNGQFDVDKDGFIVTPTGSKLTGYQVLEGTDTIGNILGPLQIPLDEAPPKATASVGIRANLDSRDSNPIPPVTPFNPNNINSYNSTTSLTVFDSQGNPRALSLYFVRENVANNQWRVYASLDGSTSMPAGGQQVTFNAQGEYVSGSPLTFVTTPAIVGVAPVNFPIDLENLSQFGSPFSVTEISQDGFRSGQVAGFSISGDGVVQGRYTNGQTKNLGQVALVTFRSPNGLVSLGNNLWAQSPDSGPAVEGKPGDGLNGVISSGLVEESNVDLTQELVNLIIQQRNYQANAQSIRTQDQILQTLVNLR